MERIPESHRNILEGKNFGHLATLMPDGSAQVTPVWVDVDGNEVVINTAEGRQKDRNLQRDQRVAISVADHENPYRYIQIRGCVKERTTRGADEHIDKMAKKYMGWTAIPTGVRRRSGSSTGSSRSACRRTGRRARTRREGAAPLGAALFAAL